MGDGTHVWLARYKASVGDCLRGERLSLDFAAATATRDSEFTWGTEGIGTNLALDAANQAWFLHQMKLYRWALSGTTITMEKDWAAATPEGQEYALASQNRPWTFFYSGTTGTFYLIREKGYVSNEWYPHRVSTAEFTDMGEVIEKPFNPIVFERNPATALVLVGEWGGGLSATGRWSPGNGDGWEAPAGGISDPTDYYWFLGGTPFLAAGMNQLVYV